MFDLTGKTAFVTGASSDGLGRHFALTLARAGANVVVGARRKDKLIELAKEIEALGRKALAVELDVTQSDSVEAAFQSVKKHLNALDILVNNAGALTRVPALDQTEQDWDRVLDSNLKGTWLMSQAAAKLMIEQGRGGSIVNISSISAVRCARGGALYQTAKAGVSHLTRSMALDLVDYRIRVNAIAPGWFFSDMTREFLATEEGKNLVQLYVPMKRVGLHHELDAVLLLLVSDASSYMTGTVIPVDGGYMTNAF